MWSASTSTKAGLQPFLDRLGFHVVGFGCTTCIGNSGPLDRELEDTLTTNDLIAASVLSGNRNFEARIHQSVKANFLMSPPLVVAFAIAGRIDIDLTSEPLASVDGREVYLRDIWPSMREIESLLERAFAPGEYRRVYTDFAEQTPMWNQISAGTGHLYDWDPDSLYIREPPYFDPSMAAVPSADFSGRGRWRFSTIRSRPITSAPPVRSSRRHPRETTCDIVASRPPTSTATVRAAATTKSWSVGRLPTSGSET